VFDLRHVGDIDVFGLRERSPGIDRVQPLPAPGAEDRLGILPRLDADLRPFAAQRPSVEQMREVLPRSEISLLEPKTATKERLP
jgi:hypothetical protein